MKGNNKEQALKKRKKGKQHAFDTSSLVLKT